MDHQTSLSSCMSTQGCWYTAACSSCAWRYRSPLAAAGTASHYLDTMRARQATRGAATRHRASMLAEHSTTETSATEA